MDLFRRSRHVLQSARVPRTWVLVGLLGAMIVSTPETPRAVVVVSGFFDAGGVNCDFCDNGGVIETPTLDQPLQTLAGAKWVQSPNGTFYAGGIPEGRTVRFHLELNELVTRSGGTHFLVIFTTAVSGNSPGLLHVRDTSQGAKGEIKMIGLPPTPADQTNTGLIERVYRTPGADNIGTGFGTGPSSDPLPWDHPINRPVVDFALHMSDLDEGSTWGLAIVLVGVHRLPCHCEPGGPQSVENGCVPDNAQNIGVFTDPQLYCPAPDSSSNLNSCGKQRATAWACPALPVGPDPDDTIPLPFTCTVVPTADGNGIYTCSNEEISNDWGFAAASSCSFTAKLCK